jgi:hypothetical protein
VWSCVATYGPGGWDQMRRQASALGSSLKNAKIVLVVPVLDFGGVETKTVIHSKLMTESVGSGPRLPTLAAVAAGRRTDQGRRVPALRCPVVYADMQKVSAVSTDWPSSAVCCAFTMPASPSASRRACRRSPSPSGRGQGKGSDARYSGVLDPARCSDYRRAFDTVGKPGQHRRPQNDL